MILHHIGVLVSDIEESTQYYCGAFGYEVVSDIVEDRVHTAAIRFLKLASAKEYLELVSPLGENSKLSNALKKSSPLHHLCYQVRNIYAELEKLRGFGFFVLHEPVNAAAFPDRKIAWCMDAKKNLIELVERGDDENAPLFIKD